ncbi:helix-turn-helix domain-containing protein [Streptomyces aurantiacus]|nr:helix-turn-helix domain-containing protein [Streptomyces aurantiacus]
MSTTEVTEGERLAFGGEGVTRFRVLYDCGVVCGARTPAGRLLILRFPCSLLPLSPGEGTARASLSAFDVPTEAPADAPDTRNTVPPRTRQRALAARIHTFIRDNLGDAHLTPYAIASAHHISLRYLHKLFHEDGHTVAGWIREHRLEQCRRDLGDPRLAARPVHAIASRWGFTSPSHFSHAFRSAYGISPSQFRRQRARVHAD